MILGIGGKISQLGDSVAASEAVNVFGIAFQPDVISILIGINDIWHRKNNIFTTDAQIETNYRAILTLLREKTNAKIVMLAPYVLDAASNSYLADDLRKILPIIRKLADEFADVYIPLDEIFEEALKTQPEPLYYSGDGVHPNANGAAFIGQKYAEAVEQLLK